MAQTPVGRRQIAIGVYNNRAWPLMMWLARLKRRTLARRTRIITVIGSFGKTTTTRALIQALDLPLPSRPGGNALSILAQRVLRIRPGQERAVLEVGISRHRQMTTYAAMLRPNVTVVTSIGSEHNRSFGTLEVTRHEKAEMVRALPPDGLAALNGDDPHVRWMATQTCARVQTFGFGEHNDVRASSYALDWPHGSRFTLHAGDEIRQVRTRLLGRHQVYPLLAAATVGLAEGFAIDDVLPRLEAVEAIPGRMQIVPLENGAFLLRDDFKSGLETIEVALETLAEIPARRIAVLGSINEPPSSQGPLYQRLGQRLGQIASQVVICTSHRNFRSYARGARGTGLASDRLTFAGTDVLRAIEVARAKLQPGDVVLVKGRLEERLGRVGLALAGRDVRCALIRCDLASQACETCPMLETGWANQPSARA
jgi:UDP-N-acetylmuramyl pentapeptide synthase